MCSKLKSDPPFVYMSVNIYFIYVFVRTILVNLSVNNSVTKIQYNNVHKQDEDKKRLFFILWSGDWFNMKKYNELMLRDLF